MKLFDDVGNFVFNTITYGTDCAVCIGWRVLLTVALSFFFGVYIG